MNSKFLIVVTLWFISIFVMWCSTSLDSSVPAPQGDSANQAWSASDSPSSDPMAWLTDTEKQFMQYYIDEWKQRLQNIWEWWVSSDTWYQRADRFAKYHVYTSLTPYSSDKERLKVFVAVYTNEWVPVQSLIDLESSGKRWNIIIDGTQHVPYMDAWFFFESEFRNASSKELTIEFNVNWELVKESILLP
jgi:hypothetical protein